MAKPVRFIVLPIPAILVIADVSIRPRQINLELDPMWLSNQPNTVVSTGAEPPVRLRVELVPAEGTWEAVLCT